MIAAVKWAVREAPGLKGKHRAQRILTVLAEHANDERACWPTILTIAYETEVHPNHVREDLRLLVDLGLIVKDGISETNGANRFRLNLEAKRTDTYEAFALKHRGSDGGRQVQARSKAREERNRSGCDVTTAAVAVSQPLRGAITTKVTTTENHQEKDTPPPAGEASFAQAANASPKPNDSSPENGPVIHPPRQGLGDNDWASRVIASFTAALTKAGTYAEPGVRSALGRAVLEKLRTGVDRSAVFEAVQDHARRLWGEGEEILDAA